MRTAADGFALKRGLWDLYVRLDHQGLVREGRLGAKRADDVDDTPSARCVGMTPDRSEIVVSYYTDPYSNLTIDIGDEKKHVSDVLEIADVEWDMTDQPALVVTATSPVGNLPADTAFLHMDAADSAYRVECTTSPIASGSMLETRITPAAAANGGPLPAGRYGLRLSLSCAGRSQDIPVPAREGLKTVRWWRRGIPYHARCVQDASGMLVLSITRVRILKAIGRRLGL